MEVCPPEPCLPPGAGLKQTYSVIHGDRLSAPQSVHRLAAGRLVTDHNAVVLGQSDAAGRSAGLAAQDGLGVQERAVGAPRRALGAPGGRLDAPDRALDARERQLGAEAAVLAPPGGRPLDARRGYLAPDGGDRRVGSVGSGRQRQWRSESDLAGSEDAPTRSPAPADSDAADSDSDLDPQRRQAWRSETHLAAGSAAAGRGTLSQRHRSQPCLLAARPDYSGVSSRVAAYIQSRRQQDRAARARRRRDSHSPEHPAGDAAPWNPAADADPSGGDGTGSGGDCHALAARLAAERAERRERERQLEQLQTEYEQLVTKYAEAETYIDRMRFHRAPGAERPGSEAPRSALHVRDGWDATVGTGKMMISPNETHTSQSSRFSKLSGVKSAILRRHSDEESSFRRFVQSKKELFPDGVGSKDSSFCDRGSVDLNDSVKNHIEEGPPYDMSSPPLSTAVCVDMRGGSALPPELSMAAGWGPTSAPPALRQPHGRQSPSACSCGTENTRASTPKQETAAPLGTRGRRGKGDERTSRRAGESLSRMEDRGSLESPDIRESSAHSQAVKLSARAEKRGSDGGERTGFSPVERRHSRGSSAGDRQRVRDLTAEHLEKSRDVLSEHRRGSHDSVSLGLSESRDLSLEDDQTSVPSQVNSEPSVPSVSSRDSSPEHQQSSRAPSLERQRSSRDSGSTTPEGKSRQGVRSDLQKLYSLSNSAAGNSTGEHSTGEHQSMSRDRRSEIRSRSRDEVSEGPPKSRRSSPTGSYSSRISERNDPSKSRDPFLTSHSRTHASKASWPAKSRDLLTSSILEPSSFWRRRCRSSSDPGYGRRGVSPVAETTEEAGTTKPAEPPASRDRLQGVLSVLASQVEVIQAMVGRRGRSSRVTRRCRSLSRRISRNRVSVSPGNVVDRVEVVGVPIGRRSVKSGGGHAGRYRSERSGSGGDKSRSAGRWFGSVDWTGGRGGDEAADSRRSSEGMEETSRDCGKAVIYRDASVSPTRWSADRGSEEPPPPGRSGPVRRRHPAGVGPAPGQALSAGRSTHSCGHRISDNRSAARQDSRSGEPNGEHELPSAGLSCLNGQHQAPSTGTSSRDGGQEVPSGNQRHQRAGVPPLPLSELESEQGEGAGSYCSLVSPRTVSPTRKVEQWRARLAEVSPEPPPDPRPPDDHPSLSRPGPELRRLAGAVRGLQRQMSGFCRLVDDLRTPGSHCTPATPVTPGSPGSSEASGTRRRRRYLRERRGLQLPLLPDKPAPPAPGAAQGPARVQGSAPAARRWDIRRPPTRRAASCERAVQTETAGQAPQNTAQTRYAVSRSDGEFTPAATAAQVRFSQQYRDTGANAQWDRANLLAREVNLRSRCILEGVIRSTAC